MACKVLLKPVRLLAYDDKLGCYVSRVVAYRAVCDRHGRLRSRATRAMAAEDARQHRASVAR